MENINITTIAKQSNGDKTCHFSLVIMRNTINLEDIKLIKDIDFIASKVSPTTLLRVLVPLIKKDIETGKITINTK